MGYLIPSDYKKTIQSGNLSQVIRSDQTTQADAEQTAIEEASSYLVQKYDLATEFEDTPAWDKANTYDARNRVFLDAPAYNTGTTYNTGAYVTFTIGSGPAASTSVYKALQDGITGAWDATKWKMVCPQYQVFNVKLPKPLFNLQGYYRPGDQVFWRDKIYTCLVETRRPSDETILQYTNLDNVPYNNVFPDDLLNGPAYWGAGTSYQVAINTDILDGTYWQPGDNRCKQLVMYLVDIALYHMHAAVAPQNIPDLRVKRYDDAIRWLNKAAKGDVTANLPVLQPRQGSRNRYGGQIKNNNSW
jgi:hypothetical protein